jgi:hypothetical protein
MEDNENENLLIEFKIDNNVMRRVAEHLHKRYDESLSYSKKEELSIKFQKIYDKIMILLFVWLTKILFVWLIS